ncbi:MAG: hypothetical protein ABIF82_13160 [Planctomycetota bacterium]
MKIILRNAAIWIGVVFLGAALFAGGVYWQKIASKQQVSGSDGGSGEVSQIPARQGVDVLLHYLHTGDAEARRQVEALDGEDELLATRIYLAFWKYCTRGLDDDQRVWAESELLLNPRLTIAILRPIVMEPADAWNNGILVSEAQEVFLNLCSKVASVEEDGFARGVLIDIGNNRSIPCSPDAKSLVEFIDSGNNVAAKAKSYRASGSQKDLWWLSNRAFWKGARPEAMHHLLANPAFSSGPFEAYAASVNEHERAYLWCYYFDGALEAWTWGGAPPDAMPEVQQRLRPMR